MQVEFQAAAKETLVGSKCQAIVLYASMLPLYLEAGALSIFLLQSPHIISHQLSLT